MERSKRESSKEKSCWKPDGVSGKSSSETHRTSIPLVVKPSGYAVRDISLTQKYLQAGNTFVQKKC